MIEILKSKQIELSKLVSNNGQIEGIPKNPRFIRNDRFEKLVKSIKDNPEFLGARELIVYQLDNKFIVLCGNMRYRVAKELRFDLVPCKVIPEYFSIEQIKAIIIKDNISFGDDDFDALANEWDATELEDWGFELPNFEPEITEELDAKEDDYEMPDQMQVDVVLGDLIEIGEHRLLCGDSTDSDQVAKLMNGEKADMVFTDPPYGMNYQLGITKNKFEKIIGDENSFDISNIWAIIYNIPIIYICTRFDIYVDWQNKIDKKVNNVIIWKKSNMGAGDLKNYGFQHEFIMYWGNKIDGKRDTNIWDEGNTPKSEYQGHPTQKPISLISRAILNHKSNILLDLFLGSGSTMIASHQLKRKCYGMELDPKYCQIIIDRMRKLDPTLVIKINGKLYNK